MHTTHLDEHPCIEEHDGEVQQHEEDHEALPCMPRVGVVGHHVVVPGQILHHLRGGRRGEPAGRYVGPCRHKYTWGCLASCDACTLHEPIQQCLNKLNKQALSTRSPCALSVAQVEKWR